MLNFNLNFVRFTSNVSYLFWRLKKLIRKSKEEPKCQHCGGFLKYHAWSDCDMIRGVTATASRPPSPEAAAFYEKMAQGKAGAAIDDGGLPICIPGRIGGGPGGGD